MSQTIANLLFPDITTSPAEAVAAYPPRDLPDGAVVTRFAPSPTGFVHIGSIYISLLGQMLAKQSDGRFILRIEDTDQGRKLEKGIEEIVAGLLSFGIEPDEGFYTLDPLQQRGNYGPYQQSQRRDLYHAFAKKLVADGVAYPSFQTQEELQAIREEQKRTKSEIGYYGKWARDRDLSDTAIETNLALGLPFVIRLRAPDASDEKVVVPDAIRGQLDMPINYKDYVLLKADGLPTYHFALPIDDTLMGINLTFRGDEWLSTLPLHVQLFDALGFPQPTFAHIAPIGKKEGSTKRKLSKRKDPEAAVSFYAEKGYPTEAILAYLLNIANSSYEEWQLENPTLTYADFPFRLDKMASSLALFDLPKLDSVSQDRIAQLPAETVYTHLLTWAQTYDTDIATLLEADSDYSRAVLNIGRADQSRKDLTTWSDFDTAYGFMFDMPYAQSVEQDGYGFPEHVAPAHVAEVLAYCRTQVGNLSTKDDWLQGMRTFTEQAGFALKRGDYKRNPEQYKGMFGDVMMIYRVALTNQARTPDLYEMINVMGKQRVAKRLDQAIASLPA